MSVPKITKQQIKMLQVECERLGGKLVVVNRQDRFLSMYSLGSGAQDCGGLLECDPRYQPAACGNSTYTKSPACDGLGCNHAEQTVHLYPYGKGKHPPTFNNVIHEMAHVFATELTPDYSDESKFLAWEVAMATKLGLYKLWSQGNDYYGLYGLLAGDRKCDEDWGRTPAAMKAQVIRSLQRVAVENGLVSDRGIPQSIR